MRSFDEFYADQQRAKASWEQWQLRQQGCRPVVRDCDLCKRKGGCQGCHTSLEHPKQPPVSCLSPKYRQHECSASVQHPDKSYIYKQSVDEKYKHDSVLMSVNNNTSIFSLPGQGEVTNDKCGVWVRPLSCPDFGTLQHSLDEKLEHDRFVVQHSCHNPECPACHESWASRAANSAADKIIQAIALYRRAGYGFQYIDKSGHIKNAKIGRVDHVVFSPPQEWAIEKLSTVQGFRELRNAANGIFRMADMLGGIVIFHPFRQNDPREHNYRDDLDPWVWYLSPHFHIVGCGYLKQSDVFFDQTGWTYKKMAKRETIKGTIRYTLTHCGIAKGLQTVTYFGVFSNNKIVVDKIITTTEAIKCRGCGKELHLYTLVEEVEGMGVNWSDDHGVYLQKTARKIYKLREKSKPPPEKTGNETLIIQISEAGLSLYRDERGEYFEG